MPWARISTRWGVFYAASDGEHVTELRFPGPAPGALQQPSAPVERLARQLEDYFGGKRTPFDVPLLAHGTELQRAVWAELTKVPYGTTITYGDLAAKLGRPRAARAVGQAVGANPIPIVIPCHRVLPAAGGVGGFGPGPDWKRRLLSLENARYSEKPSPR